MKSDFAKNVCKFNILVMLPERAVKACDNQALVGIQVCVKMINWMKICRCFMLFGGYLLLQICITALIDLYRKLRKIIVFN